IKGASFQYFAGCVGAPQVRDDNEVLSAQLGGQTCNVECLIPGALPLLFALVESGEHGASGQLQAALAQFILKLVGIGWQVAVWAKLDPGVASFDDLVEEALPRDLLWILWEPHAPGVRCGAD